MVRLRVDQPGRVGVDARQRVRATGEQDQGTRDQPRDNDACDRKHRDASPVPRLRRNRRLRRLRQLTLASLERRGHVGLALRRLERRERIGQAVKDELVDALGPVEVLQLVRTEIPQFDAGQHLVLEQRHRCL